MKAVDSMQPRLGNVPLAGDANNNWDRSVILRRCKLSGAAVGGVFNIACMSAACKKEASLPAIGSDYHSLSSALPLQTE